MKRCTLPLVLVLLALLPAATASAQEARAESLDQLLKRVQRGWSAERKENERREAEFRKAKANQQSLLSQAKATLAAAEKKSETLEASFQENELKLAQLEETLRERLGTLGELFGVVRQVSGDTRGNLFTSLTRAQLPDRDEFLGELAKSQALPSADSLRRLWFLLQQEMTEQGKVVRFPATVLTAEGNEEERDVIRVGVFNAVSAGKYLHFLPEVNKLAEIGRQPAGKYLSTVSGFESASNGMARLAVDPSRGSILSLLVQTPSVGERIGMGGYIGYTIIGLGLLAGLLGLARLATLLIVGRKVAGQQKSPAQPSDGNPLGRVLSVYTENREVDPETLELKLDEAVLRESAKLDRFLWVIRIVSVVAPLMGLLGTVTGMIRTFQAITLFGTGDPKLMAGGISEALVTTMLGLFVAIPLVLIHAFLASNSKRISEVLEEQSAGLIAARAESDDAVAT